MSNSTSSHTDPAPSLRSTLHRYIVAASGFLEVALAGIVLIGLLLSLVPLFRLMPGLLIDGNDIDIRTFMERALDIVIGVEFIKTLLKHSALSCLEVLLYAIARHMVVGHESAVEILLSVAAIALLFIVRKFLFVPAPDHPAASSEDNEGGETDEEEDEEGGEAAASAELPHLAAILLDAGKNVKAGLAEKAEKAAEARAAEKEAKAAEAAQKAESVPPEAPAAEDEDDDMELPISSEEV